MRRDEKGKKIKKAEIIIIVAVIIIILLSQLIGTTTGPREAGPIHDREDLNGRTIGLTKDSAFKKMAEVNWPDSQLFYAEDATELPQLLLDGKIDAFSATYAEAEAALLAHADLITLISDSRNGIHPDENGNIPSLEEAEFTVIRAEDYAFLAVGKTPDILNEPGVRIAGITGSELTAVPATLWPQSEIVNYDNFSDIFVALESGKVDAVTAYKSQIEMVNENYNDLAFISLPIYTTIDGFGTGKNEKGDRIKEELNAFLKEILANGEYEKLASRWA